MARIYKCLSRKGNEYMADVDAGFAEYRYDEGVAHYPLRTNPELDPENPEFTGRVLIGHEGKA
jgi:hypothetical protein